jgi:hypothetical protein
MQAFMSEGGGRRTRDIDADQLDGVSATWWGDNAVIEAQGILAETEPHPENGDAFHCRAYGVFNYENDGTLGGTHVALAESLTAILPDLDYLGERAKLECSITVADISGIHARNRAELARIGG